MQVNRQELAELIYDTKPLDFDQFYRILHQATYPKNINNISKTITAWQQIQTEVPIAALAIQAAIHMKLYQENRQINTLKICVDKWDQFVNVIEQYVKIKATSQYT